MTPGISELADRLLDQSPVGMFRDQVFTIFRELPSNFLGDTTAILEAFESFSGLALTQSPSAAFLFYLSVGLVFALLFYLFSRVLYVVGYFDFTLVQKGMHFHVADGLTQKRRLTVRRDRVQTTTFRTNIAQRSIDRGDLVLDNVGKLDCSIPFVSSACADRIVGAVTEEESADASVTPFNQSFTPIHILSFIQRALIRVVLVLPIALTLIAIFVPASRGFIWPYALIVLGYVALSLYVGWRREGYVMNNEFLIQRSGGFIWWSVKVAPLKKVQSMSVKQSWIQRLRNRATIEFKLASGRQSIPFLDLAIAETMQRTVERRIRGESNSPLDEITAEPITTEWKTLPTRYVFSCVLGKFLTSVLFFLPLFFAIALGMHLWWSISFSLLMWIFGSTWSLLVLWRIVVVCLRVPKYRYAFGKEDLVSRKSFLSTEVDTVRFSRLQSISTSNNLVDGLFGLSDLNLCTAEGEVIVQGLDKQAAIQLREYIAPRMLETSVVSTDALTSIEQESISHAIEDAQIASDSVFTQESRVEETENISWQKFSGWGLELVQRAIVVFIGLPFLLVMSGLGLYLLQEMWITDLGQSVISFVFNWPFYLTVWATISFWYGSGPFREIPFKGYWVSSTAFRYKAGWLYRSYYFVPLDRIQNVKLTSLFIEKIFQLRWVKIATASEDEITLMYLPDEEAERLREKLLQGRDR